MTMPLYATDQLFEAKDYKNLVVVYRNNAPVRLSDLGRVVDGNEDVRNMGLATGHSGGDDSGQPAAQCQHHRYGRADQGSAAACSARRCPPGVDLDVDNDRTTTIRASVVDAQTEHGDLDHAGDPGRVRFPAKRLGDVYSEHLGSGFADRHLRRDVSAADTISTIFR